MRQCMNCPKKSRNVAIRTRIRLLNGERVYVHNKTEEKGSVVENILGELIRDRKVQGPHVEI